MGRLTGGGLTPPLAGFVRLHLSERLRRGSPCAKAFPNAYISTDEPPAGPLQGGPCARWRRRGRRTSAWSSWRSAWQRRPSTLSPSTWGPTGSVLTPLNGLWAAPGAGRNGRPVSRLLLFEEGATGGRRAGPARRLRGRVGRRAGSSTRTSEGRPPPSTEKCTNSCGWPSSPPPP